MTMIVRTGTPGADRFAGSGNEPFEFRGLGGNDTYTLRLFDIDVPPPPPVQGPPRTVYLRDRAVEAANGGTDTVNLVNQYGPVGFTGVYPTGSVGAAELANIEIINALAAVRGSKILSWSITAGASNNTITTSGGADTLNGGSGNDVLRSNAGNDTLIGGLGADKMYGGLGSDTYRVDSAGDLVSETGPTGVDRILSTVSINLGVAARAAGAIENVSLLGSAAISAIGNGWANSINGNAAANVLYGMAGNDVLNGGAGADRMFGGAGTDTYYVDRAGDIVSEAVASSSGTDRVVSSISFILPYAPSAAGAVENLTLLGAAAINGTGNAFANAIVGNTAANTLSGLAGNDVLNGGAGADRMFGGAGNDTYYVDSGGDLVSEAVAGSSGIDRVVSSISFSLPYAPQGAVEHLTLLGTGVANGTGNILANSITGNASNNVLNGRDGSDALTGGLGSDGFVFDTALNALTNVDTIADFSNRGGDDSMRLDDAVFTQLPTGLGGFPRTLDAAHFRLATEVADADDYIIYNDQTGVLFYDADGSGGVSQAIQFATLTNRPTLTERDFVVF
jgi:Ca2+-binding RTX toxin-like protein